jgi:GNAT superfamily N-acetyltransferase
LADLVFAIEPLSVCWDEMVALASKHWQETESYRHGQPFAPSFDRYNQYDQAGWYFEATIRDAGVLVGYAGIYLIESMHSQQVIATEDSLFIDKPYRKGRTALRFIKFLEDECRKRGAVEVNITAKNPAVAKILAYLGFPQVATHHSKQLTR